MAISDGYFCRTRAVRKVRTCSDLYKIRKALSENTAKEFELTHEKLI